MSGNGTHQHGRWCQKVSSSNLKGVLTGGKNIYSLSNIVVFFMMTQLLHDVGIEPKKKLRS